MEAKDADFLRRYWLESVAGEDALLLKVIEAIPEDKLGWKPNMPKTRTAAELALHAADAGVFFIDVVDGKQWPQPPKTPTTKADLIAAVKEYQGAFHRRLAEYTPEELARTTEFFGEKHPAITLLTWHVLHEVHHRAQLALYLRLMGAKVPGTYGPSGDDEMPSCQ